MHSTAPLMINSPRQAPSGAAESPEASAASTPMKAMPTPSDLRSVSGSMPRAEPTNMDCKGNVERARLARAAVV